ncbi:hypothetical protein DSO57_1001664 [Entomophthora muscae]|uniref:Uncharacterized protein n=1 Tax=Entomophthora muscae TaxID=34485 RepID=A0ACC2TW54_9FUNG|nr:hypothetical protein DSO57_1001664 [Entomophthora muscae]
MTLPLTPQPDRTIETPTTAETTSTQLFGVLYITLTGMVDSMIPTSGPWSLLGQSMSYIIKLAPILWWALPTGLAQPHPKPLNASTSARFPEMIIETWVSVESNPGPPEIDDPKQGEQKPANLPSVNTRGLKSTLETLELNPDPPKTTQVAQSGQEPAKLLNCKPELTSYSKTRQSPKDNSPNGHQIAVNLTPLKIWTYAEVVACLKEVKTKLSAYSANDLQQLPVFYPEWAVQLNYSGDVVNSSSGMKHCHFCSPEQTLPGSATLKTLDLDPCPTSSLSVNLNPAKIKEARPMV